MLHESGVVCLGWQEQLRFFFSTFKICFLLTPAAGKIFKITMSKNIPFVCFVFGET